MRLVIFNMLFLLGCSASPGGTAVSEALDAVSKAVPRFSFFSREQVVIYYYECKDKDKEYEETNPDTIDNGVLEGDSTEHNPETVGRL